MEKAEYESYRRRLLGRERELDASVTRVLGERNTPEPEGALDVGDRAMDANTKEGVFYESGADLETLRQVREALDKDEEDFGKCVICGNLIEKKRLEAVPWARFCLYHQERQDNQEQTGRPSL